MSELRALIVDRIRTGGPISFAEYMELALYHPSLGYYARASRRTGRAGDFFTSVDVGPLFGELLAKQLAEMWRVLQPSGGGGAASGGEPAAAFDLVEAGAGSGRLARDILETASRRDPGFHAAIRLHLVERSPAARAAQPATLGPHALRLASAGDTLPGGVVGAIVANELLDALPTHAVIMTRAGLRELFVDVEGDRLVERPGTPSTPELARYLARAGVTLPPGWRAEVNLAAVGWIRAAARSLQRGFLLIVDYGHEAAALYAPSSGTLTTFRRHVAAGPSSPDRGSLAACLADPGECDITAHVDLTALTQAAEAEGLTTLGRLDQTYFLMGLADLTDTPEPPPEPERQRLRAFKTLVLPGGLGSTHKVLVFGRGVETPHLSGCSYRMRLT
jgi:SAM-dependent MidA family methyltransferase